MDDKPAAPVELVALAERGPGGLPRELPPEWSRTAKLQSVGNSLEAPWQVGNMGCVSFVAGLALLGFGCYAVTRAMPLRAVGVSALAIVIVAIIYTVRAGAERMAARDRRLAALLANRFAARPFPIDGYDVWLTADQPMFDVHLARPVDVAVADAAAHAIDPRIVLAWSGSRVRVLLPSTVLRRAMSKSPELRGGDLGKLEAFLDGWVAPLHREAGVTRIEMGGTVDGQKQG